MTKMVFILTLVLVCNQDREIFANFYYDKFTVDQDFKKSRIKYPLTIIDATDKQIELRTWEQRIDTLLVAAKDAVFISQTDMMVITDRNSTLENTFKKIDGLWYLTELRKLE